MALLRLLATILGCRFDDLRQRDQERRTRRMAWLVTASLMLILVLAGLTVWSEINREEALRQSKIALSRQLAAQAALLVEHGRDASAVEQAAALATESWKRLPSPEAADAARRLVAMLPSVRLENGGPVDAVAFSSDGQWLATGSSNKTARVIEIKTGREQARIEHDDVVSVLAFSRDGRLLATGSRDKTARLIEIATGKEVARIAHDDWVCCVAFSPDGRWLATASNDRTARLVEIASGKERARIEHGGKVTGVAFSPDGHLLATWSADKTARLVETVSGREVARIVHGGPVREVAFNPKGRWLATASEDKTARLIEIETVKELTFHRITWWSISATHRKPPEGRICRVSIQS
jgi:WD40 repeat protein